MTNVFQFKPRVVENPISTDTKVVEAPAIVPQQFLIEPYAEYLLALNLTPYIVINVGMCNRAYFKAPEHLINQNHITININPGAINRMQKAPDGFMIGVRFSGNPVELFVPFNAIRTIYAHETQGQHQIIF